MTATQLLVVPRSMPITSVPAAFRRATEVEIPRLSVRPRPVWPRIGANILDNDILIYKVSRDRTSV